MLPEAEVCELILQTDNLRTSVRHLSRLVKRRNVHDVVNIQDYVMQCSFELSTGDLTLLPNVGFLKTKPGAIASYRPITVPSIRRQCYQRLLLEPLRTIMAFSDSSLDRSAIAYAIANDIHTGKECWTKLDIKGFYNSVERARLFDELKVRTLLPKTVELVDKLTENTIIDQDKRDPASQYWSKHLGLPQGHTLSPLLANLYVSEIQSAILPGVSLYRYVDDILLLSSEPQRLEDSVENIRSFLADRSLRLGDEKTDSGTGFKNLRFLGLSFDKAGRIIPTDEKITVLREKVQLFLAQSSTSTAFSELAKLALGYRRAWYQAYKCCFWNTINYNRVDHSISLGFADYASKACNMAKSEAYDLFQKMPR